MKAQTVCETKADEDAWPLETCIIVTAAGRENLALRQLVRQAIPIVERPEDYPLLLRKRLVRSLKTAVETEEADKESSAL